MFDDGNPVDRHPGVGPSPFERGLAALLSPAEESPVVTWPAEVGGFDVVHAELLRGRRFLIEPGWHHLHGVTVSGDGCPAVETTAVETTAVETTAVEPPAPESATTGPTESAFAEVRGVLEAGFGPLARAAAAARVIAQASAVLASSLAEFARCRPAALLDRLPGATGAMSAAVRGARPAVLTEVSEWAVDEVAGTLRVSSAAAGVQLAEALTLAERLPATLAALGRGELSPAHARQLVAVVGPVADDGLRADIEAHVLGLLGRKTPPQLGDCARRVVLRRDAEAAARRLVQAVRDRGVRLHDRRDGTATLALDLPLPTAAAIHRTLEAYAEQARTAGDQRTKQQRMADCLTDLVLRHGEHRMPPVTIALTLVATLETMLGGNGPGLVEGMPVPAALVRELGYTFGLMPRPAPHLDELPTAPAATPPAEPDRGMSDGPTPDAAVPQAAVPQAGVPQAGVPQAAVPQAGVPQAGARDAAAECATPASPPDAEPPTTPVSDRSLTEWMALARARHAQAIRAGCTGARQAILDGTWTDGDLRAVLDLGALIGIRDLDGTALAHRPHIAIADQLRGCLVALTDATAIRRGEALGPPDDSPGYTPGAALDRFVRLRDQRCRMPGCRQRARTCDLDHRRAWPDGPTAHHNLCCLCEHHHRLKHQAPGWHFDQTPDGALAVTMPDGEVLTSRPPRFGADPDLPPY